jgi:hypothetical protein
MFWVARINGWQRLSTLAQVLLALFTEVCLEKSRVAGIGPECGISKVANEGDYSNTKIEQDVDHHPSLDRCWKSTIDLHACLQDENCHEHVQDVTNAIRFCVSLIMLPGLRGATYAGIKPRALPQPKRTPQQLKRARSRR